jgi:NAD(P)-dependent dehydrogenase (short-subunit alcohol dehydrogenase family)
VHVTGSFNTTRSPWPHMVEEGYGRIVMTTSAGMFGLPNNVSYATMKGAVIGLTRSLTTPAPLTASRSTSSRPRQSRVMAGKSVDDAGSPQMSPGLVAPMVAFLAHEACPVTGEIYAAGAGRFARTFIASTKGYVHPGSEPTIEDVAENWATINDEDGYYVPTDLPDWSAAFMAHLHP